MCALHKELALEFAELCYVEIACGRCGTKVSINLAGEQTLIPSKCPSCNQEYGEGFDRAIRAFRTAYGSFQMLSTDSKNPRVGFRIPLEAPEPKHG